MFVDRYINGTVYYKDKTKKIIHREDGPAIEWENGGDYYLNNFRFSSKRSWEVMKLEKQDRDTTTGLSNI